MAQHDDCSRPTFTLFPRQNPRVVSNKVFQNRRPFPLIALSVLIGLFVLVWIYFFSIFHTPHHSNSWRNHHYHSSGLKIQHTVHSPSFRRTIFRTPAASSLEHKDLTLLLTITNDTTSWGSLTVTSDAVFTFEDFISRIRAQQIPVESLHLGLLTSDLQAYNSYVSALSRLAPVERTPWARAEIIYLEKLPGPNGQMQDSFEDVAGESRHDLDLNSQTERRRYLARLRNFLSSHMLTPEVEHVIWLDADVYGLPAGLFKRFQELGRIPLDYNIDGMVKAGLREAESKVMPGENNSDSIQDRSTPRSAPPIGLITLRCQSFDRPDYDRNAWSGFGKRPPTWVLNNILRGTEYAEMGSWAKAVSQLISETDDTDLVKLDSVGGTALYIRADLLREGLVFPVHSIVGTEWGKDGKDGIETEGLCYIAERLGWGCYALGGTWRTLHADV
ncbi:hypothetical protein TWF788_009468 [Orbilia oligospora]|uniref:Golgi mannosyltransferase complex subunit n=1 Tax=Orbilia oligospora TaxID=2813651 RepID=A0A7C8KDJ2_ORBOL|nr:hypothetical protein TWF788_009468 [Orbilia oligospora]